MVYIDNFNAPFGRMVMCHMVADSTEELLAMADKIGVQRKWLQDAGTRHEHFDVCLQKKALAVKRFGAKAITWREMGKFTSGRKDTNGSTYKPVFEPAALSLFEG